MTRERGFGLFHILMIVILSVPAVIGWQYYQKQQAIAEAKAAVERERVEIKKSVGELVALFDRWRDAEKLASSTPRIAMAAPVASLQEIRRQTESLSVSPCLATAKASLATAMAMRIETYVAFMANSGGGSSDEATRSKFIEFATQTRVCKER